MKTLDDCFQQAAFRLGYRPEDLLPIDPIAVENQCAAFTRSMAARQREFYVNKKMKAMIQRQNRILTEVQKQVRRNEYSFKLSGDRNSSLHNPTVIKLLKEHERIMQRNQQYLQSLFRKQEIDRREKERRLSSNNSSRKIRGTGESPRGSQTSKSNRSRISAQSQASSTASNKERLLKVRQQQKQEQRIRRQLYLQRQQESSKKSLRAEEQQLKRSQRVKMRSEINKQIVKDNRRDLQLLRGGEMKDHLQRLKFKIQQTEQVRIRNSEHREARFSRSNYQSLRKYRQDESRTILKGRYEEKVRTASMRLEHQNLIKNEALHYNRMNESLKSQQVQKKKQLRQREEKMFVEDLLKKEEKRLQTAELKRNNLKTELKYRHIEQDIRREETRKNAELLRHRQQYEALQLKRKMEQKFNEISEINDLKNQLSKQRKHKNVDLSLELKNSKLKSEHPDIELYFNKM